MDLPRRLRIVWCRWSIWKIFCWLSSILLSSSSSSLQVSPLQVSSSVVDWLSTLWEDMANSSSSNQTIVIIICDTQNYKVGYRFIILCVPWGKSRKVTTSLLTQSMTLISIGMACGYLRMRKLDHKESIDEHRLETLEMKALRQILRVSWTAKKTNSWVLEQAGVNRSSKRKKLKVETFRITSCEAKSGQIAEKKIIIQGTLPGSRTRGRLKTAWIDSVTSWTGLKLEDAIRNVDDRSEWRKTIHSAAYVLIEDG